GAHHLRARTRDPGLPAEGVLVDHRAPGRAEPAALLRPSVPHWRRSPRSGEIPYRERDGRSGLGATAAHGAMAGDPRRAQGTAAVPDPTVHHVTLAAGGVTQARLRSQPHHAHR